MTANLCRAWLSRFKSFNDRDSDRYVVRLTDNCLAHGTTETFSVLQHTGIEVYRQTVRHNLSRVSLEVLPAMKFYYQLF